MNTGLTIALVQTEISRQPQENLDTARNAIEKAASQGVDLVVFPEMFMARPQEGVPLASVAEPLEGPFVTALAAMCRQYGIHVLTGLWERVPGDEIRAANVVVALDSQGEILARYNKIHLFDALSIRESDLMRGDKVLPPLFTINGVQLGVAICYDLRFPELFRDLALRGADAVIVPSAWYAGPVKEEHWLTLLKARAIENTLYVAGANLCGAPFAARSAVFDPFGVMIAGAGETATLVIARLDPERIGEVRTKLPSLSHVQRGLFKI